MFANSRSIKTRAVSFIITNKKDFNEVVEENTAFVTSIVRKFVRNPETVKDLTQEIFLKAYLGYGRYSEDGKIKAWLAVIAHNMLKDHYKAEKYQSNYIVLSSLDYISSELLPSENMLEDIVIQRDLLDKATKVINSLPEKQRDIIVYSYFYDYSDKEIASVQNMSLSAVKSSKHYGLQKVRNIIGAEYGYKSAGYSDRKYRLNNSLGRYKMIKCYAYNNGIFTENTNLQNESIIELISPTQGEIESAAKILQKYNISEYDIKALIDGDFDKIKADNFISAAKFNNSLHAMIIEDNQILLCHDNKDGAPKELMQMFQGLWASININDYINLDFAAVHSVLSGKRDVFVGAGSGKGENKKDAVADMLASSPELNDVLKYTAGVIVNIVGSPSISLDDIDAATGQLMASMPPNVNIVWSCSFDGELDDEIIFTVTASR